jgi:Tfp pilus assembly protein PilF
MIVRTVLVTIILIGVCSSSVRAESTTASGDAAIISSSEKAISKAKNAKEAALLTKKLGDAYVLQEDYQKASDEFIRALSLNPSAFSVQDRIQMAVYLSWANRLDESVKVLREVLVEDPGNIKARAELAKMLSWSDKLTEARSEADQVLQIDPNNRDALLVKANILRWQGDAKGSIPLYEKALQQGEDFDARLGLAHAELDRGEWKEARENADLLTPKYPYQEKALKDFEKAYFTATVQHVGLQYSYYRDTDHNTVNRTTLFYGFKTELGNVGFSYRYTDANDPVRDLSAQDLLLTLSTPPGRTSAVITAGVSRPDGGDLFVGSVRVDHDLEWGSIAASLFREQMSDIAQLIENRIVRSGEALFLTQSIMPRTTLFENYTHASYSDSNHSDDIQLGVRRTIMLALPRIDVGYRFRYWDFERQSRGGYFDPDNFTSHQIFASLLAEKDGWYIRLEPYFGLQAYMRYGEYISEAFHGATASAGWMMKKNTSFELNGEGGNYAGGAAAGFDYYQVGFRFFVYF